MDEMEEMDAKFPLIWFVVNDYTILVFNRVVSLRTLSIGSFGLIVLTRTLCIKLSSLLQENVVFVIFISRLPYIQYVFGILNRWSVVK